MIGAGPGGDHHPAGLVGALVHHQPAGAARDLALGLPGADLAAEQAGEDAVADRGRRAQTVELGLALDEPRRPQRRTGVGERASGPGLDRAELVDRDPDPVLAAELGAERLAAQAGGGDRRRDRSHRLVRLGVADDGVDGRIVELDRLRGDDGDSPRRRRAGRPSAGCGCATAARARGR